MKQNKVTRITSMIAKSASWFENEDPSCMNYFVICDVV